MKIHSILSLALTCCLASSVRGHNSRNIEREMLFINGSDPFVPNGTFVITVVDGDDAVNASDPWDDNGGGTDNPCGVANATVDPVICQVDSVGGGGGSFGLVYLDELLSNIQTTLALDNETAIMLELTLGDCDAISKNHGQFIKCMRTNALQDLKSILTKREWQVLKRAIAKSDFGKTAADILEEESGLKLNKSVEKSLDKCNKMTRSKQYQKCLAKQVAKLVKSQQLSKQQAKKLKKTARKSQDVQQQVMGGVGL